MSYLSIPLDVPLPEEMWVYVSFSTDAAGWVIADGIDWGSEVIQDWDCFGGNPDNEYLCQICFNFNDEEGDPLAAMATEVYCYDEGMIACETPPSTLVVDLISYDAVGAELDRFAGLVLYANGDDGDPGALVYHNDLDRPIMLFDEELLPEEFPMIIPLRVGDGGTVVFVASVAGTP